MKTATGGGVGFATSDDRFEAVMQHNDDVYGIFPRKYIAQFASVQSKTD